MGCRFCGVAQNLWTASRHDAACSDSSFMGGRHCFESASGIGAVGDLWSAKRESLGAHETPDALPQGI
jgi:hypothetical protein